MEPVHWSERGEAEEKMLTKMLPLLGLALLLAACSGQPRRPEPRPHAGSAPVLPALPSENLGNEIALRAMAQIGRAYRYGGADLEGFDCSGLVYFIHQELGLSAPRTAQQQFNAASPVTRDDLVPGDLVFFRFSGARISHVGIYAGEGRFIHAPQTGRNVEFKRLDDAYYARYFAGAGRLGRGL